MAYIRVISRRTGEVEFPKHRLAMNPDSLLSATALVDQMNANSKVYRYELLTDDKEQTKFTLEPYYGDE